MGLASIGELGPVIEEALRRRSATSRDSLPDRLPRMPKAALESLLQKAAESAPKTSLARLLPKGSRALCEGCYGRGLIGDFEEVIGCALCGVVAEGLEGNGPPGAGFVSYEPCEVHVCQMCMGKGVVCPQCRAARFLRQQTARGNRAVRCPVCTEGNNVLAAREMEAIRRELARLGL